jgi:excisionase family DNA binding protein
MENYLTVRQFAKRAKLSASTIRRWIRAGKIKAIRRKCRFCDLQKTCKRDGKCNRVLQFFVWRGLKVGITRKKVSVVVGKGTQK